MFLGEETLWTKYGASVFTSAVPSAILALVRIVAFPKTITFTARKLELHFRANIQIKVCDTLKLFHLHSEAAETWRNVTTAREALWPTFLRVLIHLMINDSG